MTFACPVHLFLLAAECCFLAWVLVHIFQHRDRYGPGAFLVLLGTLQPLQNLLACMMELDLGGGWRVNPGSAVLFPANLLILFLLDVLRRRPDRARLLKVLFLANVAYCLLCGSFIVHCSLTRVWEQMWLFVDAVWLALTGAGLLWVEASFFLFSGWDRLNQALRQPSPSRVFTGLALRVAPPLLLVLLFDSLAFTLALRLRAVLHGDWAGDFDWPAYAWLAVTQFVLKIGACAIYVVLVARYFAAFDRDSATDWMERTEYQPSSAFLNAERSATADRKAAFQEAQKTGRFWAAYGPLGRLGMGETKSELYTLAGQAKIPPDSLLVVWLGEPVEEDFEPVETD